MKYLFFDTETTGVPKDYRAPLTDSDNWPRLVQLAWILTDDDQKIYSKGVVIIYPEKFNIPEEAMKVHGISTRDAKVFGVELEDVLNMFVALLNPANLMVGHNISFDRKIIGAEFMRAHGEDYLHGKPRICTMHTSTKYCQIPHPNRRGIKWPKLQELHVKLFDKEFEGAHDALADIEATMKCFFELRKRGVISDQKIEEELARAAAIE